MKQTQNIVKFCAAMVIGSLLAAVPAMAGTAVAPAGPPAKNVVQEVQKSCITGSIGVSLTNEYIARGLVLDKDTFIAQPYLNLYFMLWEGEGFLNRITFNLPLWWSLHNINKPRVPAGTKNKDWYEFDVCPGLAFTFAKDWTFTVSDEIYNSPGGYFDTSQSINLRLDYDDSKLLGRFAMHPHLRFLQEVDNHSGLGTEGNTLGQMYEIGIAPGFTFEKDSAYPVTVTLPATVAFGTNGYYGQGFGYFSIGAIASTPLAFIPSCYGTWTTSLSGLYYYLGTNASSTDDPSAPGLNLTNGANAPGRRNQGVVAWSIGTAF